MSFREEIIWAAGLFEGEGSFCITNVRVRDKRYWRVQASLHTTDKDVLERFVAAIGFGGINGPYTYTSKTTPVRKPSYYWSVASFEKVQAIAAMFWPWLGSRRKATVKDILKRFLEVSPSARKSRNQKGRFV